MQKTNQSFRTKWVVSIIIFSLVLILSAIFLTVTMLFPSLSPFTPKETGVSVKKVYTSVTSSDGEPHNLAADFYITSSKKHVSEAEVKNLKSTIIKTIKTLDYNEITKKNGTNYFIDNVKKNIKSLPGHEWVEDVYISNLILDVGIGTSEEKENNNALEEMFKNY